MNEVCVGGIGMELAELSAYAKEKYQIEEQHKWADFPGFSVLCHPQTGKWVALLMRQWDSEAGEEIERCDMKCGAQILKELHKPYLSAPIRMKGDKWINIAFNPGTEPEVVFRLFDHAVIPEERRGATIVLDSFSPERKSIYNDTPLPFAEGVTRGFSKEYTVKRHIKETPPHDVRRHIGRHNEIACGDGGFLGEAPKGYTIKRQEASSSLGVPDKITKMIALYEYGDGSLSQKARAFYRQGKFMEDYEDNMPWRGEFRRYFPTYHDLNVQQLRGYFTWRTYLRKGDYRPIATSLAYLYLYELLCGIGADTAEDVLCKMREFEIGFLDSGIGASGMRQNLHRWMFEYAILHNLPKENVIKYVDPVILEKDRAFAVLKAPDHYTDEEIFSALSTFAVKNLQESPVCTGDESRGIHLFAEVWRYLSKNYLSEGKDIFSDCFGEPKTYIWYPLANAVYWEERTAKDTDYILDECRSYHLRGGVWWEKRYERLYFDRDRFQAVLHEADRLFRKYRKTGHYLRKKQEEAWVTPYIEAVIEAEEKAQRKALTPEIIIDFSGLDRIRQDAIVTRDSLLTDEEMGRNEELFGELIGEVREEKTVDEIMNDRSRMDEDIVGGRKAEDSVYEGSVEDSRPERHSACEGGRGVSSEEGHSVSEDNRRSRNTEGYSVNEGIMVGRNEEGHSIYETNAERVKTEKYSVYEDSVMAGKSEGYSAEGSLTGSVTFDGLDALHLQLLRMLLRGQAVDNMIKENRWMSSIVADTINEALFDEIGDNVLECDGDRITVVEDYKEDVIEVLGGINE